MSLLTVVNPAVSQAVPQCIRIAEGLRAYQVISEHGMEIYLTGYLGEGPADLDRVLEGAIRWLADCGAQIVRERVFVPDGQLAAYQATHQLVLGANWAGMPRTWLRSGSAAGTIQIYAVGGASNLNLRPLKVDGEVAGWTFGQGKRQWAVTGGLCRGQGMDGPGQIRSTFLAGESVLAEAGMTLHDLARTWIYMDDILSWYGQLNAERNRLFIERGLLLRGERAADSRVPASTGMGVSPAEGGRLSIEFFAASGVPCTHYAAAGRQRSAYEYGSAFARATELSTPGGTTLFVSGTAAIDAKGVTCHPGNIDAQIEMTLTNVNAIFEETSLSGDCAVESIAYCKTPAVAEAFRARRQHHRNWPWVIVVGDVCRADLLFETEVTACRPEVH